ncbi:alpha/beta fold hydrolase [Pseudoduganella lutea]|uniref:Alpha/beta hydrolase n=1 Tax=Pseudoduganella lutea TaxID=321985 RepID=A0A4P6KXE0_9BURK|nr:alpha/beta hydrolase [Pseudoduganella lutea]QBE63809.1 alpha/beta hydrolase [Pseudoduganella lutea]
MIKPALPALLFALALAAPACRSAEPADATAHAAVRIDALFTPDIGGIRQAIEIKTDDAGKPVLLFLSGGPGSSMMNGSDAFSTVLKKKFTIVHWDQRGAGRTLKLNASPGQPTVGQMGSDTRQVIDFLREKLKKEKIYLLGSSWGNVLGFHIVRHHPELLHAYFAVNPVVSQLASEKELLAALKHHFKDDPVATSELAGVKLPLENDSDLFFLRKWLFYKDGMRAATTEPFKTGFLQWSKAWSPVWREVMQIDLPGELPKADCPVYFFVGKNDIQTSAGIATQYFQQLEAPKKALVLFDHSGHQIHKDEPEKFQDAILAIVDAEPVR